MAQNLLDLIWMMGSVLSVLGLAAGFYVSIDYHFHASKAAGRLIARLALYDSLGTRAMRADVHAESP